MCVSSKREEAIDLTSVNAIGRVRMALYGLVNLPTSIVGLPIALYIPAFYSQNLGLSLAVVGVDCFFFSSLSRKLFCDTCPLELSFLLLSL